MFDADQLAHKKVFSFEEIVDILNATDPQDVETIRKAAEQVLLENCGTDVNFRGLIEASNICVCDCFYCGIRKSNANVDRYLMDADEIVGTAMAAVRHGYGSIAIQTGERSDPKFVDMIVETVRRIKTGTRSESLPDGLGITLSVGQQTKETYRRFYEAGAHRYLLRIETTNPDLFAKLHPVAQTFESRVECLGFLRETGFQVGTGVMIGLPGQTIQDLARDIAFFVRHDVDMIGMGPFIPHPDTPMGDAVCPDVSRRLALSMLMIAAARLAMKDINLVAATALQALNPVGRERALRFGANVMMPLMTPDDVRADYQLYPGKPCVHESSQACRPCLERRIESIGRTITPNAWGDSRHALRRTGQA